MLPECRHAPASASSSVFFGQAGKGHGAAECSGQPWHRSSRRAHARPNRSVWPPSASWPSSRKGERCRDLPEEEKNGHYRILPFLLIARRPCGRRLLGLQDLQARGGIDAEVGGRLFVERLLFRLHDVRKRGIARFVEAEVRGDDRERLDLVFRFDQHAASLFLVKSKNIPTLPLRRRDARKPHGGRQAVFARKADAHVAYPAETGLDVVDGLLIRFCAIVRLFLKATKENGYVRTCDSRN